MKRELVGRIWLQLVLKHYLACRDGDEAKRAKLFDLIDALTEEYPKAVQAEIEAYTTVEEK